MEPVAQLEPNFDGIVIGWSFQNCVWQSRSPTKMAATVQLRCYWKQLWSRWAITGSWEPLVVVQCYLYNSTPEFSDILWHATKIDGPNVFLLTNVKLEYSNILYNPTHFHGPLVCRIRQVPLCCVFIPFLT